MNRFERYLTLWVGLCIVAGITLFGFESGAALATVVGVLIEVPLMLVVVKVVNTSKGWYERGLERGLQVEAEIARERV